MAYNSTAIRELLKAVFDDESLQQFCHQHFRPVYRMLTDEMSSAWKRRLLLDFCERYSQFDKLLSQLSGIAPRRYRELGRLIETPPSPPPIIADDGQNGVVIGLKGSYATLSEDVFSSILIKMLSSLLNVPSIQIDVRYVNRVKNSVVLFELPTEAIDKLVSLHESNHPVLREMDIVAVKKVDAARLLRQLARRASENARPQES